MNNYSFFQNPNSYLCIKETWRVMPSKSLKIPIQKRSIATRNKLKKAARTLFSNNGYYKVTSIQIAKAASVPVGSFYNYFGNKKGILLELIEDFNEAFHKETLHKMENYIQDTIDQASAKENLERMLVQIIDSPYLSDPFYKMFHALQFTEEDALQQAAKAREMEIHFLERFLRQVNEFHPIPNIPVSASLLFATGENLNLYINHLGTNVDQEKLIEEAALMFCRYIFAKKD